MTKVETPRHRQHLPVLAAHDSVKHELYNESGNFSFVACIKKVIKSFLKAQLIVFVHKNTFETDSLTWAGMAKSIESLYASKRQPSKLEAPPKHDIPHRLQMMLKVDNSDAAKFRITVRRYAPLPLLAFFRFAHDQRLEFEDDNEETADNQSVADRDLESSVVFKVDNPGFHETSTSLSFLYANETLDKEQDGSVECTSTAVLRTTTTTTTVTMTDCFTNPERQPYDPMILDQFQELRQIVVDQTRFLKAITSHMERQDKELRRLKILALAVPYEGAFEDQNSEFYL